MPIYSWQNWLLMCLQFYVDLKLAMIEVEDRVGSSKK